MFSWNDLITKKKRRKTLNIRCSWVYFFGNVKMVILPSTLPKSAGNQVSFLKSIHLNGQYPTTNRALALGVIELNQVSGVFVTFLTIFSQFSAHKNCLKITTRFPLPPLKKKQRGHSTLPPFLGPLDQQLTPGCKELNNNSRLIRSMGESACISSKVLHKQHMSLQPTKTPPHVTVVTVALPGRGDTFLINQLTVGFEAQIYISRSPPKKRLKTAPGKKRGRRHPRRTSPPTINPPNQERSFQETTKTLESPRTFVRLPSANASVEHWHLSPCPLFFGVSWGSAVNDVWVILEIWPPQKKHPEKHLPKLYLKSFLQMIWANVKLFYVFQPTFCFASCFWCSSIFQGVPIKP